SKIPVCGRPGSSATDGFNLDFHTGDYETGLVISADHPELAKMSMGLDMLWNRIITLTVFAVLLGGMGLGMIFLGIRI
ncbi:hypothetical protein ACC672_37960, partial [Rhizobium ruizarguesonis]